MHIPPPPPHAHELQEMLSKDISLFVVHLGQSSGISADNELFFLGTVRIPCVSVFQDFTKFSNAFLKKLNYVNYLSWVCLL